MANTIPGELSPHEDEVPSVFCADIQSHGFEIWDSSMRLSSAPKNPANASESYSGQDQEGSASMSTFSNEYPTICAEHGSFDDSIFGNLVTSTSVEILQVEASPFDTTQIPHIAFEDPGVIEDAGAGSTINGMSHEPHLDLGYDPRLRGVHQAPHNSTDPSNSRLYPLVLGEFDEIHTTSRVTNDAPCSHQGLEIGASNLLTPWGGGAHDFGGYVSPLLPHYGHMRSSSSPDPQLHYQHSNTLLLWRQGTYVSASFPVISSRYVALNLLWQCQLTSSRPSSSHSAPVQLEQDYFNIEVAAPSPCPSMESSPSGFSDPLRCNIDGCEAIFTGKFRRGNRGRHILRTHKQTIVYACNVLGCNRTYKRSDALLKHQRSKHRIK